MAPGARAGLAVVHLSTPGCLMLSSLQGAELGDKKLRKKKKWAKLLSGSFQLMRILTNILY